MIEIEKKFWGNVRKTNYCWLWFGSQNTNGYGYLKVFGKTVSAHRFSAKIHGCEKYLKKGIDIDHTCRTRNCVNPDHFSYVPHSINMKRINNPSLEWTPEEYELLEFNDLNNNEKCLLRIAESNKFFGGLLAVNEMIGINRLYDRVLITEESKKDWPIWEQIVKKPYKHKYFKYFYHFIKQYGLNLEQIEQMLEEPISTQKVEKVMYKNNFGKLGMWCK